MKTKTSILILVVLTIFAPLISLAQPCAELAAFRKEQARVGALLNRRRSELRSTNFRCEVFHRTRHSTAERQCRLQATRLRSRIIRLRDQRHDLAVKIQDCDGAVTPTPTVTPVSTRDPARGLQLVNAFPGGQFTQPIDIQAPPDGGDRLFIAERGGKIKFVRRSAPLDEAQLFLDLGSKITTTGSEQGLLGLAFHPRFNDNGIFFVNYSRAADGATVIARYSIAQGDANHGDINSEQILLTVDQPFDNHNGGALAFGPEGFLYIALGDGGSGGDPLGNAQNRNSLLGKILRIDVNHTDSGLAYAIPDGNPFASDQNANTRGEIFAYGLRNPWRISFDPIEGTLWAGDVGQSAREEVDIIVNGGNYGWNIREGSQCYSPPVDCGSTGLRAPVFDYSHSQGEAVTGGYVYWGKGVPGLQGLYVYADYSSGKIWAIEYDQRLIKNHNLIDSNLAISTFGVDQDGELYLASYGDGRIFRFDATS